MSLKPDSFGWNAHGYLEAAFCLGGRGYHKTLTDRDPVRKGTAVLMPPGIAHNWVVVEKLDLLFVQWNQAFLSPFPTMADALRGRPGAHPETKDRDRRPQVLVFSGKAWVELWNLLQLLHRTYLDTKESDECRHLLGALWHRLERNHGLVQGRRTSEAVREGLIDQVLAYLQTHFAETHTVADLSRRVSLSADHFTRRFTRQTGYHLGEYIHDLRTREACRLLAEGKMNVSEISERVGYRHVSHFIRTFQKITGTSPMRWRG